MQLRVALVTLTLCMGWPLFINADPKPPADAGFDWVTLDTVPVQLKSFWKPITTRLQQGLYNGSKSNDRSLRAISNYCVNYGKQHPDPTLIHFMILDLSQHPSEFRAIAYGAVVIQWDETKTRALLAPYLDHGTPEEKAAANDFIADWEESDKSVAN